MPRRPDPVDFYGGPPPRIDLDTPHHEDHLRDNVQNAGCHRCAPFIGRNPNAWVAHRLSHGYTEPGTASKAELGLREAVARGAYDGYRASDVAVLLSIIDQLRAELRRARPK